MTHLKKPNLFLVIIRNLCQNWNLTDDENHALQFCEPNNKNYVTEKNRNEVKNGSVLRLCFSPTKTAHDILEAIKTGSNIDKTRVLEQLASLSSDLTFALEFIKEQGLNIIITMVENEQVKLYPILTLICCCVETFGLHYSASE